MNRAALTPSAAGFRMPAEWEPHRRCWLAWPVTKHRGPPDSRGHRNLARLARCIARFEPVIVVASPKDASFAAAQCGPNLESVLPIPVNDLWMRDTGPTFLVDPSGNLAATAWRFNAWGEKERSYANDAALAGRLIEHLSIPRFDAPLVNEGGAFSVDGAGTVLTTESALLNPNRNPGLNRAEIETSLLAYTGARKVVWLPGNPFEEVTDGHVDGIAVFARPGVVIVEISNDPADPDYSILQENLRALRLAKDAHGRSFEIFTVRRPPWNPVWPEDFAASYVNFYIANGAVIMPRFGHRRADAAARAVIAAAFPDRQTVGIQIDQLAAGGGGIHCVTQQQPAGKLEPQP